MYDGSSARVRLACCKGSVGVPACMVYPRDGSNRKVRGMRTAYLQRWTEDLNEDLEVVRQENEIFIDARRNMAETGGLCELADLLK